MAQLSKKASEAVNAAIQVYDVACIVANSTEKAVAFINRTNPTFYIHAEGKVTIGARAALNWKGLVGTDINMGSVTAVSFSFDYKNGEWQKPEYEFLYKDGTVKKTFGMAGSVPVGLLEGLPIGVGASFEMSASNKNGKPQDDGATERSVSLGVGLGNASMSYKDEKTNEGMKRTGKISIGAGGSIGIGAVGDYKVETGFELQNMSE